MSPRVLTLWVVALALPTAVAPGSALASGTYLLAMGLITAALWRLATRSATSRAWGFVAAAASCWLIGDLVQRFLPLSLYLASGVGPPDVFWIASYPLVALAVALRVRERGLPIATVREVVLDATAVAVAVTGLYWQLSILGATDGDVDLVGVVVSACYPLGDVALLASICALRFAPGRRPGDGLLATWVGATLVMDLLYFLLPTLSPDLDLGRLDAVLLIVNALLPLAVAQSRRGGGGRVTDHGPTTTSPARVVFLAAALLLAPVVGAVAPAGDLSDRLVMLTTSLVVTTVVLVRLFGVIGSREAAERRSAHEATHDSLTGLANRSLLVSRARDLLREDARASSAVIYVDVDQFKMVNDVHGHAFGDAVLCAVAERISGAVRPSDVVARVGGDEFVVLCPDVGRREADDLATRLKTHVDGPVCTSEATVPVVISVGLAHGVDEPVTPVGAEARTGLDAWLHAADSAMYAQKRAARPAPEPAPAPTTQARGLPVGG